MDNANGHPPVDQRGTYRNPILSADYSDPDVIRVGGDYYLVSSSFNMVPGLPILHSKDLLHWSLIGHGIQALPKIPRVTPRRSEAELDYDKPRRGCGVYAPCIRYHENLFWIFWSDPDAGIYRVQAEHPEGPWSKPHLVQDAIGIIDPSPLWDEETHKAYCSYAFAKSRCGYNSRIDVREMSWDGTCLLGNSKTVFDAYQGHLFPADRFHEIIEGTKFLKRHGYYYIFCPAGSVAYGWQTVMRAQHPLGPYEIRTICESGDSQINGPHQGGLIDTPEGEWWFIHFQDVGTLGRITWLQPSRWHDDWPMIGEAGRPVLTHPKPRLPLQPPTEIAKSENFLGPTLGLQWQWPANNHSEFATLRYGQLILHAQACSEGKLECCSHVITQMFPGYCFSVTAKVELCAEDSSVVGGLVALGRICSDLSLRSFGPKVRLALHDHALELDHGWVPKGPVWLRMEASGVLPLPYTGEPQSGAIHLRYAYSLDNRDFVVLGPPLEAHAGTWIGARWGLFCSKENQAEGDLVVSDVVVQ